MFYYSKSFSFQERYQGAKLSLRHRTDIEQLPRNRSTNPQSLFQDIHRRLPCTLTHGFTYDSSTRGPRRREYDGSAALADLSKSENGHGSMYAERKKTLWAANTKAR